MRWPYPAVVAHRGGGALAPENTLGAIRLGASLGFGGVEFDVMLAGDGVPVLIHDETTQRTTGVAGEVARLTFPELQQLDAGKGEKIPSFEQAGALCRALGIWANVEIKPAAGHDAATGAKVAERARSMWHGDALPPILSSFSIEALVAAREAVPDATLGWLVDEVPADWRTTMQRLGCIALHCNYRKLTQPLAREVCTAGYGLLCWTVNQPQAARSLRSWGVHCIVTDALREIGPQFA